MSMSMSMSMTTVTGLISPALPNLSLRRNKIVSRSHSNSNSIINSSQIQIQIQQSFRATPTSTTTCFCQLAQSLESVDSMSEEESEELKKKAELVGSRVRLKAPLKVYHIPKVPEFELAAGTEGVVKQFVGLWKGKRISANFPFKIEFFIDVPERGSVKFFAHLKEDEFDFL